MSLEEVCSVSVNVNSGEKYTEEYVRALKIRVDVLEIKVNVLEQDKENLNGAVVSIKVEMDKI